MPIDRIGRNSRFPGLGRSQGAKMRMLLGKSRDREQGGVRRRCFLAALVLLWGICPGPLARSDTATVTQTLQLQLAALGKVSVPASVSLASGSVFGPYTGSLTISYRVRSTVAGSGGNITVQASGEFVPSGGPTISSGALTYACTAASLGIPCSGTGTVSLGTQTNVLTIPAGACTGGGGACSAADPNTVNMNLSLENNPAYETGNFTAQILFTISST